MNRLHIPLRLRAHTVALCLVHLGAGRHVGTIVGLIVVVTDAATACRSGCA